MAKYRRTIVTLMQRGLDLGVHGSPFRVAIEVVEKLEDNQSREYLYQMILENVLSIGFLLTVFSEYSQDVDEHERKENAGGKNRELDWIIEKVQKS
ncbi:hypothetical protein NW211_10275 [Barnesiella sp. ET7]|uniref:hypothetical protein n=1 Tax=Barnesiella sp. ET7 TaxID=2972460 RepID=UPI0021ACB9D1|nr:hypothetical protein [Barnesiella sp. ET7]MCR8912378.1 hypothetical protein [Barnesiella sp. ET7]